jgi:hypothetical protein
VRIRHVPRERDEELLDWIAKHEAGWTWKEITPPGMKWQSVQRAVLGVLAGGR